MKLSREDWWAVLAIGVLVVLAALEVGHPSAFRPGIAGVTAAGVVVALAFVALLATACYLYAKSHRWVLVEVVAVTGQGPRVAAEIDETTGLHDFDDVHARMTAIGHVARIVEHELEDGWVRCHDVRKNPAQYIQRTFDHRPHQTRGKQGDRKRCDPNDACLVGILVYVEMYAEVEEGGKEEARKMLQLLAKASPLHQEYAGCVYHTPNPGQTLKIEEARKLMNKIAAQV